MRRAFRRIRSYAQRRGQWYLLYKFSLEPQFDPTALTKIMPPKDCFWADPFAIERDGEYHIFFEELPYNRGYAHISMITLHRDGTHSAAVPILETGYHLSYPFLLEHEGELFMIPEAKQNGAIDLYRCVEFPHRWVFHSCLMKDVWAVDATLWLHDERWWLFTNMAMSRQAATLDTLYLFSTHDLFAGQWEPHPENPIVQDVTRARPAGNLFINDGILYRPSQNCGPSYGYAVNLNRIDILNEEQYQETKVRSIEPQPDKAIHSVHTINHIPGLTLMDGLRYKFRYQ